MPPKAGVAYLTTSGAIVIVCEGDPPSPKPEGQVLSQGKCVEVDGKRAIAPQQ